MNLTISFHDRGNLNVNLKKTIFLEFPLKRTMLFITYYGKRFLKTIL